MILRVEAVTGARSRGILEEAQHRAAHLQKFLDLPQVSFVTSQIQGLTYQVNINRLRLRALLGKASGHVKDLTLVRVGTILVK